MCGRKRIGPKQIITEFVCKTASQLKIITSISGCEGEAVERPGFINYILFYCDV